MTRSDYFYAYTWPDDDRVYVGHSHDPWGEWKWRRRLLLQEPAGPKRGGWAMRAQRVAWRHLLTGVEPATCILETWEAGYVRGAIEARESVLMGELEAAGLVILNVHRSKDYRDVSVEVSRRGGLAAHAEKDENGKSLHAIKMGLAGGHAVQAILKARGLSFYDPEVQRRVGRKGGHASKAMGTGIHDPEVSRRGRETQRALGVGFHDPEVQRRARRALHAAKDENGKSLHAVRMGRASQAVLKARGLAFYDPEVQRRGGRASQTVLKARGLGFYDPEVQSRGGRAVHAAKDENGKSLHAVKMAVVANCHRWHGTAGKAVCRACAAKAATRGIDLSDYAVVENTRYHLNTEQA